MFNKFLKSKSHYTSILTISKFMEKSCSLSYTYFKYDSSLFSLFSNLLKFKYDTISS